LTPRPGGERNDGLEDAHAEEPQKHVEVERQNGGRKLNGTKTPDHQDIGRVDRDLSQLSAGKRHAERKRWQDITLPQRLRLRRNRFP